MRIPFIPILAFALLTVAGCSRVEPSSIATTESPAPAAAPPAQSPKPSAADALAAELRDDVTAARAAHPNWVAEQHAVAGEKLLAENKPRDAVVQFLAAVERRPNDPSLLYDLAGAAATWGKPDAALAWLNRAIDAGYWNFHWMADDARFAELRKAKPTEFDAAVTTARTTAEAEGAKLSAGAIVKVPAGTPPKAGWPVVVFLHGNGDRKESYAGRAEEAARHGHVGVAVTGPVGLSRTAFAWSNRSFDHTHNHIQAQLATARGQANLDLSRVYLAGFSHGAQNAIGAAAAHPDAYAGVIALSPGGDPELPERVAAGSKPRPLYLVVGRDDLSGTTARAKQAADLWKGSRWPLREATHPGRHQFPKNWGELFPEALRWLAESK